VMKRCEDHAHATTSCSPASSNVPRTLHNIPDPMEQSPSWKLMGSQLVNFILWNILWIRKFITLFKKVPIVY